jgi:DUF1365 family protein
MKPAARLFMGQVMHRRLRPVVNRFVYPVCFCLLPLSALEASANRLFSINRFNLLSFHYADHGARDGSHPLAWIRSLLAQSGLHADGEIWLQCFPRMLGFVFNPVSFWFCHAADGTLVAVLAEVSNTFGQRHRYLLAHDDSRALAEGETLQAAKTFHVSPFLAVQGHYRFRFYSRSVNNAPFWRLARIEHADAAGDLLHTALSGQAAALDAAGVLRAALRYPFMTLLIVLRIHWQALKLWCKGAPFFRQPPSPLNDKQP